MDHPCVPVEYGDVVFPGYLVESGSDNVQKLGTTWRRNTLALAGMIGLFVGTNAVAQSLTLDSNSGIDPATSWFKGKLYALWKDPGASGALEYAVFDGSTWSLQMPVSRANSNVAPSIATFGNELVAAWKGKDTDQRIWYSVFDGSHWSPQAAISGAKSLGGPALSVSNVKLYAVWKGGSESLSSASFDGKTWSKVTTPSRSPVAGNTHPFSAQDIARTALTGVDQGKYGDCVFQSSVVAAATTAKGQQVLSRAIVQNADGSFTVTFPGDVQHPVKVTENQLITAEVQDQAKWARILEAALVVAYPTFANGAHPPVYAPKDKNATGSPAIYAMYLLTGSPASKDVARSAAIGSEIARALGNGQPVVAFCANNDDGALVSGHEWTVTSYSAQTKRITLRNPWGNFRAAGTSRGGISYDGQGEVSMSLEQFGKFYDEVTFGFDKA